MKILFIPSEKIEAVDQLSHRTVQRLLKAYQLYHTGDYYYFVVSGGKYNPTSVQKTAAAELMKNWLISQRVPADRILTEITSRDSFENVQFSLRLFEKSHITAKYVQVVIVSQWQHACRLAITFWFNGWKNFKLKTVRYKRHRLSPLEWLIEWFYLAYHLFDPLGKGWLAKRNRWSRTFLT